MPLTKISINPFFWIIIFGSIFTGQFIEIITLFAVVIIHELGHIFAAKNYGWRILEVQLLPFGGMTRVEQKNESVCEELIVAICGPLQNIIMIIIAIVFQKFNLWSNEWTTFFIQANLLIGLFNLLPISPLDGSKILRALFYLLLPYKRATKLSIFVSLFATILLLIFSSGYYLGFKVNFNGLILSIFFIYNNVLEIKQADYSFWHFLLKKINLKPKRNVKATPIIVQQDITLIDALNLLYKGRYHFFYLLSNNGEIIKIIPEEKLIKAILEQKELNKPIIKINV